MKKLIFILLFIILTYSLSFSENLFPNKLSFSNGSEGNKGVTKEKEVKLGNEFILSKLNNEKKYTVSNKKTGASLIIWGGVIAATGGSFLVLSISGIEFADMERYRVPGFVLLGTGAGMMVLGYILRKSADKNRSSIILNLNPFKAKAEIGYRINF